MTIPNFKLSKARRSSILLTISVCIALSATIFPVVAQTKKHADVKGNWKMQVETSIRSGTPIFVLKHVNDSTVTGTYTGQLGESAVQGTIKGKVIHLWFEISGNDIDYSGTVDGDTMKGNVILGSMGDGTFTGTRGK